MLRLGTRGYRKLQLILAIHTVNNQGADLGGVLLPASRHLLLLYEVWWALLDTHVLGKG